QNTGIKPSREDGVEAQRALDSGGATMAALFLRFGDAKGALEHLAKPNTKKATPGIFWSHVRSAANNDRPKDWASLAVPFARQGSAEQDPEVDLDPELTLAGLWGTSLEAYRREPDNLDIGLLLSRSLMHFGMPEAAPLVVGESLVKSPTPAAVS